MKIYSQQKKILIIKFGGLGDVILSLNAINSIVCHHKTKAFLLTEKPFDELLIKSGWFNQIITINRGLFYFMDTAEIKERIKGINFDFVYDLQTSKRTAHYLKLFKEQAITNGIGEHAKVSHDNQNRNNLHTHQRQKEQISLSNVPYKSKIDISWLLKSKINLPKKRYAMIVPGGSKKRKNKRIPFEIYSRLVNFFLKNKIQVLVVGSKDDEEICKNIERRHPGIKNLCCKTNFFDIGKLSKYGIVSIGNDTGPMHLIAQGSQETFVFFTKFSNPQLCGPIGKKVSIFEFDGDQKKFYEKVISKLKIKLCL